MLHKKRKKPVKLLVLESLSCRTNLSAEGRDELRRQRIGYEGECRLDTQTGKLTCDCLVLNDLPLIISGTDFQIDALIITAEEIILYEVKNYGGEYIYKEGFFESVTSSTSFHSPTERVNRHTSLLRDILKKLGFELPIQSYVVFIHPEFMLYDGTLYKKVLLQSTLPKHFRKVNACSGIITPQHRQLADKLCEISDQTDSYLKGIPKYTYEECKKGVICGGCGEFIPKIQHKSRYCICAQCGYRESISALIVRHFKEFRLLFPERRATLSAIYEWCGGICSRRRIRLTLQREFTAVSAGKYRHYV